MKRNVVVVLLLAGLFACGVQLYAHHSFTATYFEDKTVKIEGKLITFQFRNPHSFVTVEAPDDKGVVQRWGVEWGGAGQLGGQGVTRETFKSGDHVVITGNPGRTEEDHRIRMVSIRRPSDGVGWGGRPGQTFD
jgi:hypothetical protein